MTQREKALRQGFLDLSTRIERGLATGQLGELVDVVDAVLPELRRLRGEAWLEHQARVLKPRRPRITKEVWSRAARGDREAQALIEARYARRKNSKQLELTR